jgi:hypothetical protein
MSYEKKTNTDNHFNGLEYLAYTDEKINKLVYELYGLSEEEIGIVEGKK